VLCLGQQQQQLKPQELEQEQQSAAFTYEVVRTASAMLV
jgi:hypothetical protein